MVVSARRRVLKWFLFAVAVAVLCYIFASHRTGSVPVTKMDICNSATKVMLHSHSQTTGQAFTLQAKSIKQLDASHILFESPYFITGHFHLGAQFATLYVKEQLVLCEGPVEMTHPLFRVQVNKAYLYLGGTPSQECLPARSE